MKSGPGKKYVITVNTLETGYVVTRLDCSLKSEGFRTSLHPWGPQETPSTKVLDTDSAEE